MDKKMNDEFNIFVIEFGNCMILNPHVLANVFSFRVIGNKCHGDMAEIGVCEAINKYMNNTYICEHVGKAMYRAKEHEEDIRIQNKKTKEFFDVSIKAYGNGPLQLSTESSLYSLLKTNIPTGTTDKKEIDSLFMTSLFLTQGTNNILPFIYDENKQQNKFNLLLFDFKKALAETTEIKYIKPEKTETGKNKDGRKHPIFSFLNASGKYIMEIRYGDATANALQRGVWTNTKTAFSYFISRTNGWISYSENNVIISAVTKLLISKQENIQKWVSLLEEE